MMVLIPAWFLFVLCVCVPLLVYVIAYNWGRRDGYLSGMKAGVFVSCLEERSEGGHEL